MLEFIIIHVKPGVRFQNVGDWYDEVNGVRLVEVAEMPDDYALMVAVHEMIEQHLCRKAGISESVVNAWDAAHLDAREPGDVPGSPYTEQHQWATCVEQVVAMVLGVPWHVYERDLAAMNAQCAEIAEEGV